MQEVCPVEELKVKAIATGHRLAGKEGLNRKLLSAIKHDFYKDAYRALLEPTRYYSQL